jgi:hypothetical protein
VELNVKTFLIADLELDQENVRKHSPKNLESIKVFLRKFGQVKPIVLHRQKVVAGNGTLRAAKDLGWNQIDAVSLPEDWDYQKVKAYAIADNRTAELADWDIELLSSQLEELKEYGFDLEDTGFDDFSLNNMVRVSESKEKGSTDPYKEWIGMPDFESEDKNAAFRVVVRFKSEVDADDFFKIIDRPKKSALWWPEDDGFVGSTVKEQYINVEE